MLEGSSVGNEYGLPREYFVVIDHEGNVRYRTPQGAISGAVFDDGAIRKAIAESLEDLNETLAAEAAAAEAAAAEAATAEESAGQTGTTAVFGEDAVPGVSALYGNYPNPFNAGTAMRSQLVQMGPVSLDIYDIQGRLVRRLWQGILAGGEHQLAWDGRDERGHAVATGVYLSHLVAPGVVQARKMMLVR